MSRYLSTANYAKSLRATLWCRIGAGSRAQKRAPRSSTSPITDNADR